ncbi:MAG TPA: DUF1003 domain-containing protein [Actinomycetota bacterium]|jgi:uncharacterized membrane protein
MSVRPVTPAAAHPALTRHAERRAASVQNRIADWITRFAGSMWFVYLSALMFLVWMVWVERKPWPTLTLVVSLEAIFLSTFVMISQNRADEKRAVIAAEEWQFVQQEEQQNEQLLELSQQILALTDAIHKLALAQQGAGGGAAASGAAGPAPGAPPAP